MDTLDHMNTTAARSARFVLVVYRMPTKPTAGRVAVWRQLKKIGAIYLHQSVCVFPDTARTRRELQPIRQRIEQAGGEYHLLPLRQPSDEEYDKLVAQYIAAADLSTQRSLAGQIENLLLTQTPIIFGYFYNYLTATAQGVTGVYPTAIGHLFLYNAAKG